MLFLSDLSASLSFSRISVSKLGLASIAANKDRVAAGKPLSASFPKSLKISVKNVTIASGSKP